ncbi:MAG: efflux RND transporter periplasmic adaptor subunit [Armatimonadetes bacterium]|nr:efflux RND transporter periplasmic adaptor subunit [Armatimonadota bacterium]
MALLIAVITAAAAFNVAMRNRAARSMAPRAGLATGTPVSVVACRPTQATDGRRLEALGRVVPDAEAAVSAKVPSRIVKVLVAEGDVVAAGQKLVILDLGDLAAQVAGAEAGWASARAVDRKAHAGRDARATEMEATLSQAEAGLAVARTKLKQAELGVELGADAAGSDADRAEAGVLQAKAGVDQGRIGLRVATEGADRLERLYKVGGIALADLQGARAQADIARSQLDLAEAGLKAAQAAAAQAGRAAPLRGKVNEADLEAARAGVRLAEQAVAFARQARGQALEVAGADMAAAAAQSMQARAGVRQAQASVGTDAIVSPIAGVVSGLTALAGEYAQPGSALMRVTSVAAHAVEAPVGLRTARRLRMGLSCTVVIGSGAAVPATVERVGPLVSHDGRTMLVRVALTRTAAGLGPGQNARVILSAPPQPGALQIPASALQTDGPDAAVFVLDMGSRHVRRRTVRILDSSGTSATVTGLSPTDRVVTRAPQGLKDGDRVAAERQ